jgi:hypothetical protein
MHKVVEKPHGMLGKKKKQTPCNKRGASTGERAAALTLVSRAVEHVERRSVHHRGGRVGEGGWGGETRRMRNEKPHTQTLRRLGWGDKANEKRETTHANIEVSTAGNHACYGRGVAMGRLGGVAMVQYTQGKRWKRTQVSRDLAPPRARAIAGGSSPHLA